VDAAFFIPVFPMQKFSSFQSDHRMVKNPGSGVFMIVFAK
jgi:hypothetical protein